MKTMVMEAPDNHKVTYTNAGSAIASGAVVDLNDRFGIAATDIAASTGVGVLYTAGRFKLTKATGVTFAVGAILRWDAANSRISTASDPAHKVIGRCAKAAATGDTIVETDLNQGGAGAIGTPIFVKRYVADATDASNGYVTIDTGFGAAPSTCIVQARKAATAFDVRVIANMEMLASADAGKVKVTITGIATNDVISMIATK